MTWGSRTDRFQVGPNVLMARCGSPGGDDGPCSPAASPVVFLGLRLPPFTTLALGPSLPHPTLPHFSGFCLDPHHLLSEFEKDHDSISLILLFARTN